MNWNRAKDGSQAVVALRDEQYYWAFRAGAAPVPFMWWDEQPDGAFLWAYSFKNACGEHEVEYWGAAASLEEAIAMAEKHQAGVAYLLSILDSLPPNARLTAKPGAELRN
jgi:hypothetical protein